MPQADLILITHEHGDHVDMDGTSIKALTKDGTVVIATATVAKFITQATVMTNGETKKWDKFTIEAVPAYNLVRGPAAGKFFHPMGRETATSSPTAASASIFPATPKSLRR